MLIEVTKNEQTGKYEVEANVTVSSGSAELEDNKEINIDVSNYSEPVEITPSSGKDGMEKVTVTLSNIPSGNSTTYYCWNNSLASNYIYFPFSVAPNEAPSNETTIIEPFTTDGKPYIKKGTLGVPEGAIYTKTSDTKFQYQIGDKLSIFTRDSTKDFTF